MASAEWTVARVTAIFLISGLLWFTALHVLPGIHTFWKIGAIGLAGPFVTQFVYRIIPKPS